MHLLRRSQYLIMADFMVDSVRDVLPRTRRHYYIIHIFEPKTKYVTIAPSEVALCHCDLRFTSGMWRRLVIFDDVCAVASPPAVHSRPRSTAGRRPPGPGCPPAGMRVPASTSSWETVSMQRAAAASTTAVSQGHWSHGTKVPSDCVYPVYSTLAPFTSIYVQ